MPLEQLLPYAPLAAIGAGLLLALWNERGRLRLLVRGGEPSVNTKPALTPAERFDKFYTLRTWCDQAGQTEAVKALDGAVLPAIVQGGPQS